LIEEMEYDILQHKDLFIRSVSDVSQV